MGSFSTLCCLWQILNCWLHISMSNLGYGYSTDMEIYSELLVAYPYVKCSIDIRQTWKYISGTIITFPRLFTEIHIFLHYSVIGKKSIPNSIDISL